MWQDNVLTAANVFFGIGLFPMLLDKSKPTLWTSIPTALCLFVVGYTQYTLGLEMAALSVSVSAFIWAILAIQKISNLK